MMGDAMSLKVYLAPGATDMRKSIDGLALWSARCWSLTHSPRACSYSATGGAISSKSCTGKLTVFGCTTAVLRKAGSNGLQPIHPMRR